VIDTIADRNFVLGHYNFVGCSLLLSGWGAATLAGTAAYQAMAPWAQGFGRTLVSGVRGSKQIALTYDDGPNDPYTLRLMDVLGAPRRARHIFF